MIEGPAHAFVVGSMIGQLSRPRSDDDPRSAFHIELQVEDGNYGNAFIVQMPEVQGRFRVVVTPEVDEDLPDE